MCHKQVESVAPKAQAIRAYLFVRQIATDTASTEKLRHSAGGKFEKRLRFSLFCAMLFVRHSFIFPVMEYNHAILYFYFPLQEKLCRNNAKYIFGVCFTLWGTLFLYSKKFFKKLLKKISVLSICDTPI